MTQICVVDDEIAILRLLERTLLDGGLDVDVIDNGSMALARALRQHYDLIILDLMLPDIDGVALLQAIRCAQPDAQIMILSAADDAANRVRCLDLGACDFVGKPFDVAELLARVRARLRPAAADRNDRRLLKIGDVTLDLSRHTLWMSDRQVALPPREFLLLRHLMDRAGEVCTREQLLADVWGYDFDPGSNVIDVYISRLRNKLPATLIETVRSVGYCFLGA
jgi:two-component system OmpR family response regulator